MTEQGADDLFDHRNDPDEWDDEPAEIDVRPTGSEVVSFRLPSDELDRVMEAARAIGESLSQFVREALNDRLESLEETLDILGDEELMASLRLSQQEAAEGKLIPLEEVISAD